MRDSAQTLVFVRLVYLARLREAFASTGETLEMPAGEVPTVESIVALLRRRGGAWTLELAPGRGFRFAVNHRVAHAGQAVADGDEVAIFPPVTGG